MNGEWVPLNFTIESDFDDHNPDVITEYSSIIVNTFITHSMPYGKNLDGIIGMTPCPTTINQYVFSY